MLKNKRVVLIALAVIFLVSVFFAHARSKWKNEESKSAGLVSGDESVGDLLTRDTDNDGVEDWEEGLWGTDPTKKDTNDDGTPDSSYIAKLKAERATESQSAAIEGGASNEENLTQTDKFARELFSTVAALNQTGGVDDGTVNQIANSLAEKIQNPVQRKIFTLADLKITENNSKQTYQKYADTLDTILKGKYPFDNEVVEILQQFSEGGEDADSAILTGLDPILNNISLIIDGASKMEVPTEISSYHLELVNDFEIIFENLTDIRQVDKDPILSYGAINQYSDNQERLNAKLVTIVNLLLGNPI